jgi:hypothetical protein
MVSVLRTLQAEWNALVPTAQELGIRRVRTLNLPLETIEYRRGKLEWLRGEIERLSLATRLQATTAITPPAVVAEQDLSVLTFGVELEIILPLGMTHSELSRHINTAGVESMHEQYNHAQRPHWKVVTDGSIGDYTRGAEVVSPVLRGEDGFRQLKTVCTVLTRVGCKVNKKCGLHVHVGIVGFAVRSVKNLVSLYHSAEPTIDSFMAPSRRGSANTYCAPLRVNSLQMDQAVTMDMVATAMGQRPGREQVRGSGRYKKLNLQSFWQHGTVEFRHHQGTVEADKALYWTKLCLRMCLAAQEGAREAHNVQEFFAVTRSPAAEASFFAQRAAFFATQIARAEQRASRPRRATVSEWGPMVRSEAAGTVTDRLVHYADLPAALSQEAAPVDQNVFEQASEQLTRRATTRRQY